MRTVDYVRSVSRSDNAYALGMTARANDGGYYTFVDVDQPIPDGNEQNMFGGYSHYLQVRSGETGTHLLSFDVRPGYSMWHGLLMLSHRVRIDGRWLSHAVADNAPILRVSPRVNLTRSGVRTGRDALVLKKIVVGKLQHDYPIAIDALIQYLRYVRVEYQHDDTPGVPVGSAPALLDSRVLHTLSLLRKMPTARAGDTLRFLVYPTHPSRSGE